MHGHINIKFDVEIRHVTQLRICVSLVTIGTVEAIILLRGANEYCPTFYVFLMNWLKPDAVDFQKKKSKDCRFRANVAFIAIICYYLWA